MGAPILPGASDPTQKFRLWAYLSVSTCAQKYPAKLSLRATDSPKKWAQMTKLILERSFRKQYSIYFIFPNQNEDTNVLVCVHRERILKITSRKERTQM